MAPKGKAPAKGAKSAEKLTNKQILVYILCAIVGVLSLVTIAFMTIMLVTLHETAGASDYTIRRLRQAFITQVNRKEIESSTVTKVAVSVEGLKTDMTKADADFEAKKKLYRSLFEKAVKSSTGPWKLYGNSLYFFAKGEKTWYDAESFCLSRDAHLASILNDNEQGFVSSQIKQASWIGLTDENEKNVRIWTDGSGLQKEYWSDSEQRAGGSDRDCTLIVPSSTNQNWKSDDCYQLYSWVCREKLDLD